jgi:hypothetical protein
MLLVALFPPRTCRKYGKNMGKIRKKNGAVILAVYIASAMGYVHSIAHDHNEPWAASATASAMPGPGGQGQSQGTAIHCNASATATLPLPVPPKKFHHINLYLDFPTLVSPMIRIFSVAKTSWSSMIQ